MGGSGFPPKLLCILCAYLACIVKFYSGSKDGYVCFFGLVCH